MNFVYRLLIAGILFFWEPGFLFSHASPVQPVDVEIRVDRHCIRMTLEANALHWMGDVIQEKPVEKALTPSMLKDAEDHINKVFPLDIDGKKLNGKAISGFYTLEPGRDEFFDAKLTFYLVYERPVQGRMLNGRPGFYQVDWDEYEAKGKTLKGITREFLTRVTIYGAQRQKVTVPLGQTFSWELDRLERGNLLRSFESAQWGAKVFFLSGALALLVLVGMLTRPKRKVSWKREGSILSALALGFWFGGFMPQSVVWFLLAATGGLLWIKPLSKIWWTSILSASGFGGGWFLKGASILMADQRGFTGLFPWAFWTGSVAALIGVVFAGYLGRYLYVVKYRHLDAEALASQIDFHRRLLTWILAGAGLVQGIKG